MERLMPGKKKKFNLTREQALKIILRITDQDDPYWENQVEEFYDEKTDSWPTIYDVLSPLGITKEEIDRAEAGA
jgi:hypothetical protein